MADTTTSITGPTTSIIPGPTEAEVDALRSTLQSTTIAPKLPTGATQTYTQVVPKTGEFQKTKTVAPAPVVSTSLTNQMQSTAAKAPTPIEAAQMQAALTTPVKEMEAATGEVSKEAIISPEDVAKGTLSEEAFAEAAQGVMGEEATIRGQLTSLLTGLEDGEVPAWASPAVEAAEAMLAERGISNSSVARGALYNAIIQSAMPIAEGDARAKQQEFLANLNNRQQAVMYNASIVANMDTQNASQLQKAQIQNAQAFLQMDFANMTNEQRTAEINHQSRTQSMLTDVAALNAARQFNATSQNQTDQFMANLATQVSINNATRRDAMTQSRVNLNASIQQFNSQMRYQRDAFNVQNALAVEQSNVNWRRQINQINTAGTNAVNQANAMNRFNLSNQALTFLWQEARDSAQWAFQASESELERATRMSIAAMSNEGATDKKKMDAIIAGGKLAYDVLFAD